MSLPLYKMTASRAQQLLLMSSYGSLKYAFIGKRSIDGVGHALYDINGISEIEDQYIRTVWDSMPGTSSYHDALVKISKEGEKAAPSHLKLIKR
jgi:hypothetical protein